jgi:DNA-binding protein
MENKPDNIIYVGQKMPMNYVTAVLIQLNQPENKVVRIISRGKFISKVIDIVEIIKNRFVNDLKVELKTSSEQFTTKEGKNVRVSTIEAVVSKG